MKNAIDASVRDIFDLSYWKELIPFLHLDHAAPLTSRETSRRKRTKRSKVVPSNGDASNKALALSLVPQAFNHVSEYREQVKRHGYAVIPPENFCDSDSSQDLEGQKDTYRGLIGRLARAAQILHEHGWPATFLAMYDEAWVLAQLCQQWMDSVTECRNQFCLDVVGFHVVSGAGFSPHRDRQPEDWIPKGHRSEDPRTTFDSGIARYLTCWVALTDAEPSNSCLHYISATVDPGYYAGDEENADPLSKCFHENKNAMQKIYCARVLAGGLLCHTHRVIHWGNDVGDILHVSPTNSQRIALSFAYANNNGSSFEPPNFSPDNLPFPPLNLRASLCCGQVINYSTLSLGDPRGWTTLAGTLIETRHLKKFYEVFQRSKNQFHDHYQKELSTKFVQVTLSCAKEASESIARSMDVAGIDQGSNGSSVGGNNIQTTHQSSIDLEVRTESDLEDAALAAMLDVETTTKSILFHDDFDLLVAEGAFGDDVVPRRSKGPKLKKRKLKHA